MRVKRPGLKIDQVAEFFSVPRKTDMAKERARTRKHAAAALWYLDQGAIGVWDAGRAEVNVWVKRAIVAYFRTMSSAPSSAGVFEYWDKLPVKRRRAMKDVRVVPGAVVRYGAFIERGAVLMPSFVNVGARVGAGTMVDTWATVGSCAQVGANVHLSGGVGLGGVLEPEQAKPVVIEDGAFLGSRAIVVEGVRVGREAVLGAGVTLTASTKIVDTRGSEPVITAGAVPERAVVIPGSIPKSFGGASIYGVPCALIIGTRGASTDLKTSLNAALRDHAVAV